MAEKFELGVLLRKLNWEVTRADGCGISLHAMESQIFATAATPEDDSSSPIYAAGLEIIPDQGIALASGTPLDLTPREFHVLLVLAQNSGRVTSREDLYSMVWRRGYERRDRSVDVNVGRVRSKLASALPERNFIHTHTGIGYRFSPTGD